MVLVSHDRWFIGQLATRIVDIEASGIVDYQGTYEEYVAFCGNDRLDVEQVAKEEKQNKQKKLQRAGKSAQSADAFLRGFALASGTVLPPPAVVPLPT